MLMIAIIGAIVCGIVMGVAHSNTKKGVAWGQPLEIVFGVLAIGFAFWAVYEQLMGTPESAKVADRWQAVRGTGCGKAIKAKCAGKKMLLIKNYPVEGQSDAQLNALNEQLAGESIEVYELPKPPETDEMGPEIMFDPNSGRVSPAEKKLMDKLCKEMDDGISGKVSADKYDVVLVYGSIPEWMILPNRAYKPSLKAFQGKKFVFVYGCDERNARASKDVIGFMSDKSLANPDDYDVPPTGDDAADFSKRFEFKDGGAK